MALVKFLNGTKEQLNKKELESGCIYFVTDTGEIYVDVPGGNRISFSSDSSVDLDTIYDEVKEKFLSDPDLIFKGATDTTDGTSGLVPAPQRS